MEKPNWTYQELNDNYRQWVKLIYGNESHNFDCQCNLCMEEFSLGELMQLFSEDEHATAVIRINQGRGNELVNPVLDNEFIRPEKPIETRLTF